MNKSHFELTVEECKALWDLWEREWISYNQEVVHDMLNRMKKFLDEHQNELVAGDNKAT